MYINENINNKQIICLIIGFFFLIILAIIIHNLSSPNYESAKIEEDKESNSTLYLVMSNKIFIANLKDSYTRIQTIAHECLHSIQSKKLLWFNFIFSNIYLIYFFLITILAIFKVLPYKMVFLSVFIVFSLIYYAVRTYLEMDAMIKARFLAKEYMEEIKISKQEEIYKDYGVDDKIVSKSIEKKFRKMYKSVVKEGYIDSNYCDYNCFLKWRGVSNYLDNVELYIENRGLIAFRGFLTESVFGEENYYKSSDFNFIL